MNCVVALLPASTTRVESLGETLKLPPWLEGKRGAIEEFVPPIVLHHQEGEAAPFKKEKLR